MNESNLGVRSFFVMNILHFSNKKCPIGAVMRNLSYEARLRDVYKRQSKYFIRLLSKWLSFMYLKKAAILENI